MYSLYQKNKVYFCDKTVNLTVILNCIGVKMTMNVEYGSVVGVILPVENKILPIVHLIIKLTKTHPLFTKNTAVVFLLVVKMAAPQYTNSPRLSFLTIAIFSHTNYR